MTLLGRLLVALGILLIIAAIWYPARAWELGGTAAILFTTGAAILGASRPKPRERMIP